MGGVNWWLMDNGAVTKSGWRVELVGEWEGGETLDEVGFFVAGDRALAMSPDEAAKMALETLRLVLPDYGIPREMTDKVKELHLQSEVSRMVQEREKLAKDHFGVVFGQVPSRERKLIYEVMDLRGKIKEMERENVE